MQFEIPGKPQGKARARTVYNENVGRVMSYTPEQTVSYENLIKVCYQNAECRKEWFDKEPLSMHITAFFEIPKSASKKNRAKMLNNELFPTKKPDADNIAKVVCDALNKVAYKDDTQIVDLHVLKAYTENQPRVMVGIFDYVEDEEDG